MTIMYERRELSPQVAAVLAEARKTRGWTLEKAAREIGCALSTVHCLEHGKRAPSVPLAGDIARVYQLGREETIALMSEAVAGSGRSKPGRRKAKAA